MTMDAENGKASNFHKFSLGDCLTRLGFRVSSANDILIRDVKLSTVINIYYINIFNQKSIPIYIDMSSVLSITIV